MKETLVETITKEIQPYFEGMNGCHDFAHTERVMKMAEHIAKKENANLEIVMLAALLHDIGRKEEMEKNGAICHAEKSAELSREILSRHGLESKKINDIAHCITTHRFRKNNPPTTLEAKVLFDADKLDSIGAVGIGRAFLWSGEIGAKLHNSKHHDIKSTEAYSNEDTPFREFELKLKYIKDRLCTSEGKK
ncbi:MAG: HD domain-containing protein [archaeon]|mgnify:CR=1 FL=1